MVFPFTFNFTVPGLPNPFASSSTSTEPQSQQQNRTHQTSVVNSPSQAPPYHPIPSQVAYNPSEAVRTRRISRANLPKINRPRPSPSPSPAPLSRKRGWEPTFAEPSASTATLTSTSGYLDTPAKYRDMAAAQNGGFEAGGGYQDITVDGRSLQDEEEMPPMKKRRGLAGSIISTAVSAALIGTAVGLTVYRLWRDRGKDQPQQRIQQAGEHEALTPPPPYEVSVSKSDWQRVEQPAAVHVTPPTPRSVRKTRPATAAPKRPVVYVRKSKRHGHVSPAPQQAGFLPSSSSLSAARPEFDFGKPDEGGAVEDQATFLDGLDRRQALHAHRARPPCP
ncbi:hypothetical protein NLJ89_g9004 [Agrocybe chaxingu]|uniref:Uncharacterized protein n=1 Tax=Agrocybe chaxingu TaxID=84603 RepID=A0A9W8JWK6_9AGAR|nr:hypothetical protein NLJ89_g9004 [Agrocybe chaxingu]